MLVEFLCINTVPFVLSHYYFITVFIMIYIAMTFMVFLIDQQSSSYSPIYYFLDWRRWTAYLFSFCLVVAGWIIFLAARQMTLIKLRVLGYRDMSRTVAVNKRLRF